MLPGKTKNKNIVPNYWVRILSSLLIVPLLYLSFALAGYFLNTYANSEVELLKSPWILSGSSGAAEKYQKINPNSLNGKNILRLTYDLKGACLLPGDASAIIFDQPDGSQWRFVSLSDYGQNCLDGEQSVDIPLDKFPQLALDQKVGIFHSRMWQEKSFNIEITSAKLIRSDDLREDPSPVFAIEPASVSPDIPNTDSSSTVQTESKTVKWHIRSVSTMKETKDRICSPRGRDFIEKWIDKAQELGVNYVAVETPYDSPPCNDSVAYTKLWNEIIRSRGLRVWHRHMPLAFEGIYDTPKVAGADYLSSISRYIKTNPSEFKEGDIFTPIPEPQNGGITNITYCHLGVCQFKDIAHFNKWLRDAMTVSEEAFASIGLAGKIKIGYYGFDGFVAWGANNPDWNGILEDETVKRMGNITIDHYPEAIGSSMEQGLNELEARYPGTTIVIGEWGSIMGGDLEKQTLQTMKAAQRPSVAGFNYWHMGMGGNEALVNEDFSNRKQFDEVQNVLKNSR